MSTPRGREMTIFLEHTPVLELDAHRAHMIMQSHMNCLMEMCPRKRQAKRFLIESNRMTRDSHRGYDLSTGG